MATKKILVSFKANEEYLYNAVAEHSGKSNFIKDVLKLYVNNQDNPKEQQRNPAPMGGSRPEILDILG